MGYLALSSQNTQAGKHKKPTTRGAMIWASCQREELPPARVKGTRKQAKAAMRRMMPMTSSCQKRAGKIDQP